MSIINALLTGGTIVGKICQSLSGVLTEKHDLGDGKTLEMSDLVVGGGKFIKSDDNDEHKNLTYLYNPTSNHLSMSMPDVGNGSAIEYIVKPLEKLPIDDCLTGNVGPDANVMIGPVNTNDVAGVGDPNGASVKLNVKDVKVNGNSVSIGAFDITASTSGVAIFAGAIVVTSIAYLYLRSKKGVEATVTADIPVTSGNQSSDSNGVNDAKEYKADIQLEDLGFKDGDVLDKFIIYLKTDSKSLALEERCSKSVPLTEAEKAILNA
jgi:hypothetical protein